MPWRPGGVGDATSVPRDDEDAPFPKWFVRDDQSRHLTVSRPPVRELMEKPSEDAGDEVAATAA